MTLLPRRTESFTIVFSKSISIYGQSVESIYRQSVEEKLLTPETRGQGESIQRRIPSLVHEYVYVYVRKLIKKVV